MEIKLHYFVCNVSIKKYKPSHHESGDGLGLENAFTVAARSRHCRYHTGGRGFLYLCSRTRLQYISDTEEERRKRKKRDGKEREREKNARKGFIID